jgi:hypothetical protein
MNLDCRAVTKKKNNKKKTRLLLKGGCAFGIRVIWRAKTSRMKSPMSGLIGKSRTKDPMV